MLFIWSFSKYWLPLCKVLLLGVLHVYFLLRSYISSVQYMVSSYLPRITLLGRGITRVLILILPPPKLFSSKISFLSFSRLQSQWNRTNGGKREGFCQSWATIIFMRLLGLYLRVLSLIGRWFLVCKLFRTLIIQNTYLNYSSYSNYNYYSNFHVHFSFCSTALWALLCCTVLGLYNYINLGKIIYTL